MFQHHRTDIKDAAVKKHLRSIHKIVTETDPGQRLCVCFDIIYIVAAAILLFVIEFDCKP
jgi:hypothetical protein